MTANDDRDATNRPPPHNDEAERSVLGSILIEPDTVWRVYGWLRPEHFYQRDHQLIYSTICRMADEHTPIDLITVRDAMLAGAPDATGITATISGVVDGVPDIANVEHYGRIVKRDADRRRAITTCETAQQAFAVSHDVRGNAAALMDAATDLLDGSEHRNATQDVKSLAMEVLTEMDNRLAGTAVPIGIPTGYLSIDSKTHGFPRGAVTIVGAPPKVGKTTFMLNCALNAAKAGSHVLVYSIDMPKRFVRDRLVSIEAGIDAEFVKTGHVSQSGLYSGVSRDAMLQAVMDAAERLSRISGTLEVNDNADDLAEIIAECSVRAKLGRLDVVFVDYIQQVQTAAVRSDSEHRRITHVAGRFRSLARKLNIAVVLAAQPNRTLLKGERMQLRHLAESSSLEQVPRLALMLHRPGAYQDTGELPCAFNVIIEKNEGQTGEVQLHGEMWCYRVTESVHDHDCYWGQGGDR